MNKKYKAAVIGVGFIGAGSHVPAYQTDERCELVAVADLKPGAAEYVVHNAPRWNHPPGQKHRLSPNTGFPTD